MPLKSMQTFAIFLSALRHSIYLTNSKEVIFYVKKRNKDDTYLSNLKSQLTGMTQEFLKPHNLLFNISILMGILTLKQWFFLRSFSDPTDTVMLLLNINTISFASCEVGNLPLRTLCEHYSLVMVFWLLKVSLCPLQEFSLSSLLSNTAS